MKEWFPWPVLVNINRYLKNVFWRQPLINRLINFRQREHKVLFWLRWRQRCVSDLLIVLRTLSLPVLLLDDLFDLKFVFRALFSCSPCILIRFGLLRVKGLLYQLKPLKPILFLDLRLVHTAIVEIFEKYVWLRLLVLEYGGPHFADFALFVLFQDVGATGVHKLENLGFPTIDIHLSLWPLELWWAWAIEVIWSFDIQKCFIFMLLIIGHHILSLLLRQWALRLKLRWLEEVSSIFSWCQLKTLPCVWEIFWINLSTYSLMLRKILRITFDLFDERISYESFRLLLSRWSHLSRWAHAHYWWA